MIKNDDLIYQLEKDIRKMEHMIDHRYLYNMKAYGLQGILRGGIILERSLPFLLGGFISFYGGHMIGRTPFISDGVKIYENVCVLNTSTGLEHQLKSFDHEYEIAKLMYNTGWEINERGLYERTTIVYKVGDTIDQNILDDLLKQSKEYLDEMFPIEDVKVHQKKVLDGDCEFYLEDMIMVGTSYKNMDNYKTIKQGFGNELFDLFIFLLSGSIFSYLFYRGKKLLFRNKAKDILNYYVVKHKPIKKEDLEDLRNALLLRKKNMQMLDPNYDNSLPTYQFRKNNR